MKLAELLKRIDNLNEQIHSHGKLGSEILNRINYRFRLDWNYNSNVMEGNSLTRAETRSVMIGNITIKDKSFKDISEMQEHDKVITDILKIGKGDLNLSEKRLKDIHKAIMYEEDSEQKKNIGQWKTANNHLLNYKSEKFDFAPYTEVPEKMHELINWLNVESDKIKNKQKDAIHPVVLAFQFHLKYVTIHPFYDGNGRTARIFTNLILISFGYPPVIVKLESKDAYYRYLADVQAYGGSPDLFYEFMCELLINSQELVLKAIEGESIEEADDLDKKIALLKKEMSKNDADNDAELIFNKEVFMRIYDSWLSDLIRGIIIQTEKFNDLFVNPTHNIYFSTGNFSGHERKSINESFVKEDANSIVDSLKSKLVNEQTIITSETKLTIYAFYGTLRKGVLKRQVGCNYQIEVLFNHVSYQIYVPKFFITRPKITDELITALQENKKVKEVYFDQYGNFHFTSYPKEDGEILTSHGEVVEIISKFSRNEILNGIIRPDGLIRFFEPRLLHKNVSQTEISEICNQFGATIYNHIDYITKEIGIR